MDADLQNFKTKNLRSIISRNKLLLVSWLGRPFYHHTWLFLFLRKGMGVQKSCFLRSKRIYCTPLSRANCEMVSGEMGFVL